MGTYSNIDIKFNDGKHGAYCVKGGGPLEVGSSLAAAPFWILKEGVLKAPDEKAVVRYITDEMYGWPASSRTLYDHRFFLDLSDFSNCWFKPVPSRKMNLENYRLPLSAHIIFLPEMSMIL